MKLESWHCAEEKRLFRLVRTDDYSDVAGEIVTADEADGECMVHRDGETRKLSFGPGGIRIIGAARRSFR